jgi:mono/diheme cytochrome c family protein
MKPVSVRAVLAAAALVAGLAFGHGVAFAQSAEKGKAEFVQYGCWQCHGFEGQGSVATSGGRVIADTQLPFDAFKAYVRNPTGGMPPFHEQILPDSDLSDIYAYLESLPKPKSPADIPALHNLPTP